MHKDIQTPKSHLGPNYKMTDLEAHALDYSGRLKHVTWVVNSRH